MASVNGPFAAWASPRHSRPPCSRSGVALFVLIFWENNSSANIRTQQKPQPRVSPPTPWPPPSCPKAAAPVCGAGSARTQGRSSTGAICWCGFNCSDLPPWRGPLTVTDLGEIRVTWEIGEPRRRHLAVYFTKGECDHCAVKLNWI